MAKSPSPELGIALVVAFFAILAYGSSRGLMSAEADGIHVGGRCMGSFSKFPRRGSRIFAVHTERWTEASQVPPGVVVAVKGVLFRKSNQASRVIAGPGSTVVLEGTDVYVDGVMLSHSPVPNDAPSSPSFYASIGGQTARIDYDAPGGLSRHEYTVGEDELFLLGDWRSSNCLKGPTAFSQVLGAVP